MQRIGKIDRGLLEELVIKKTGFQNKQVVQGPGFGVDTSVIKIGENKGLVIASDPTSLISSLGLKESAWLSVILTANDIATSGYLPKFAQIVFHLPNSIEKSDFEEYWNAIHFFCEEMGVAITGGHTGFDTIGTSTISGGITMFTEGNLSDIKLTSLVKPNQDLILTKSAAFSSAAILAKSFPNHTAENLGKKVQQKLAESFYSTSILPEVKLLQSDKKLFKQVSGMHDITEGGVLGGVYELCEAGGVGVEIQQDEIPIGKEQQQICQLFTIDPYRSIGSGSLLIACEKEATENILQLFNSNNIAAKKMGHTIENPERRVLVNSDVEEVLTYQEEDPYWAAFFKAVDDTLD